MEYYIMLQDECCKNYPEPAGVFETIDKSSVMSGYTQFIDKNPQQFYIKENGNIEYIDFMDKPLVLFSEKLKQYLMRYLRCAFTKPVVLADKKNMKQELYWMIIPETIECLSDMSEFGKDGSVQRLVLEKSRIGYCKLFKVAGIADNIVIIEQQIAEALLKKGFSGIKFKKVDLQ